MPDGRSGKPAQPSTLLPIPREPEPRSWWLIDGVSRRGSRVVLIQRIGGYFVICVGEVDATDSEDLFPVESHEYDKIYFG